MNCIRSLGNMFKRSYATVNVKNLRSKAFVNGLWVDGRNKLTFDVRNPSNDEIIAKVASLDVNDVDGAINAASDAFNEWRKLTPKERSCYLRKWFEAIEENKEELCEIIHLEAGKPKSEATAELNYGNAYVEWFSEEAKRCYGEVVGNIAHNKQVMHIKQPVGVASLITPWNFPLAMITRKAGAALAAGCTVVIKPAEDTPLTAIALAQCAEIAGIPKGVINVVTCDRKSAPPVGKLLCQSPKVGVVTFTGSTEVGKELYKNCAPMVKRLCLELGGNAPFIVFRTADIDKAINGAVTAKFRNAGQTCISANRFLIEDNVFEHFVSRLTDYINQKMCFDGAKDIAEGKLAIGPLINEAQLKKVSNIVKDAVSKGATVHCGGNVAVDVGKLYFQPTVLTDITPEMACYHEEIFGPVVICIRFSEEDEAVKLANATNSGLAGYFYSKDIQQIFRVSKNLEVGMVGINESAISAPEAAFGGVKESGLGREGSHYGLEEFLYIKYVCIGDL